jgi:hypothetical protein
MSTCAGMPELLLRSSILSCTKPAHRVSTPLLHPAYFPLSPGPAHNHVAPGANALFAALVMQHFHIFAGANWLAAHAMTVFRETFGMRGRAQRQKAVMEALAALGARSWLVHMHMNKGSGDDGEEGGDVVALASRTETGAPEVANHSVSANATRTDISVHIQ